MEDKHENYYLEFRVLGFGRCRMEVYWVYFRAATEGTSEFQFEKKGGPKNASWLLASPASF